MFCPKCGSPLADGSLFCGNCGAQLNPNRTRPAQPSTPKTGSPSDTAPKGNAYQELNAQFRRSAQQNARAEAETAYRSTARPENTYRQPENTYRQPENTYRQPDNTYRQPTGGYVPPNAGQPAYQQPVYGGRAPAQPAAKKNKLIPIIIIAAAAVVAIFLLVHFLGGGNTASPEGTIKKLETAMKSWDVNSMSECFESSARSTIKSSLETGTSAMEAYGMKVSDFIKDLSITPSTPQYYSSGGREYCDVQCNMSVTISVMGYEQSNSDSQTLTLVNENGQWLISVADSGIFDGFSFF